MNIEEARDRIKDIIHTCNIGIAEYGDYDELFKKDKEALEIALEELAKKDKVIDMMADKLTTEYHNKEWIKKYFYKQLESN